MAEGVEVAASGAVDICKRSRSRGMAEGYSGSEGPFALGIEVAIPIDDDKGEAFSTQTSALGRTSSFYRRRHRNSLPKQQVSLDRNQGNNNSGVSIDATVEIEEAPPIILAGGIQLGDDVGVEGAVVDIGLQQEPNPDDDGSQQQGNKEEDAEADGGLPEQALTTLFGGRIENAGRIIGLIGLGTFSSAIGGVFSRGPPLLLRYFVIDPDNEDNVQERQALLVYYMCLPAFVIIGLVELSYGLWVSKNSKLRAHKKRTKLMLIFSAILLVVTVCFTGIGVEV